MSLKLLFVINGLGVGGSERSLIEMLPYLVRADIRPVIACFYHRSEGVEKQVQRQGFDVRFLTGGGLLARVRALHHIIRADKPNLIQTTHFEANLAGRLAAVGSGVPVMTSLVSMPYHPANFQNPKIRTTRLRLVQALDSWTARHLTTHFHAVSQAAKAAAVTTQRIPSARITVIERGRSLARLGQPGPERRRQARQQLGLQKNNEVIVNVGRHEYAKGQKYLLEAMTRLAPVHPRLVLLVAGRPGNSSNELEQYRDQANLNGRVHFLGHRDDVPEILAAADLFVLPSRYEGFPGAVLEAMALGLPIVATNIPALEEIVEADRNALLVEPAAPTELAQSIETLLTNRNLAAAFGQCSRHIFEERFTLERSVARMIELYHQVAASKRQPIYPNL